MEMKVKNPWHRPHIFLATAGIAAAIIIMVAIAVVQNKPLQQKYKYGIVLDAGSSHTSVYIYEWPAEKENNTGMVKQKQACSVKGPGISSYSKTPEKAGESLKECMDNATKTIPKHRHPETPVYLGATAGMRLLKMENDVDSKKVLASVEKSLQTYPFSYQGARIITGQEEGAFGWITVNYLSENFRKASRTVGALDLGGASTQITFVPGQQVESSDNSIDFRLYGNDYHLYTHSFLCYGKDQVLKLYLEQQIQPNADMTDNIILEDPCFHPGYNIIKSFQSVFDSPCVKNLTNSQKGQNFTHRGIGNWNKCNQAIKEVFNTSHCRYSRCSFNDVFQPPVTGRFGAFSAYFFVMDFLNVTPDHSLDEAKKILEAYCTTPWGTLKQKHRKVKEKYLAEYCFSGTYIVSLLEDGYKFTTNDWKNTEFIKTIKNSEAGWTLGYMLNLTNMIPAEAPDTPLLPYGGYVSLMLVLSFLIIVCIILGCIFFRRPSGPAHKEII
ncbi:ectonucleoside triphosphate diphosphohydrolase 1 isoform X2 [Hemibagrus wyckioides]|uniref:ectonucleoside triphosphate diphosphohydrolase 1 isoform X2 n=1 Tax=Hemibagrus wyckioides TaxID=337641 RepID=UPI00266DBF56|nr:ectonucleoside triphosphate diphosphohydrolase 1 isoform X2 [Hemibagrus wyckioides]